MGKQLDTGAEAPDERDRLGFTDGERIVAIAVVGLWAIAATLSLFDRSDQARHDAMAHRLAMAELAPSRPPHKDALFVAVGPQLPAPEAPWSPESAGRKRLAVLVPAPVPAAGPLVPRPPGPKPQAIPATPPASLLASSAPDESQAAAPAPQPATTATATAAKNNGIAAGKRNGASVLWMASLGDRVNVRAEPSLNAQVLRQLDRGNLVGHLDRSDGWVKVTIPDQDKLVGWVHASLLAQEEADLGRNFQRNRSIGGQGFGNFWYEAERLAKETHCELPEFTLGDQTRGPVFTCRLGPGGPGGQGKLSVLGQTGTIKIDRVALTWQGVPGAPVFFADGPPELNGVVGKLGDLYGGLSADRMAVLLEKHLGRDAKVDAFRYKADTKHRSDGQDWELVITDR